MLSKVGTLLVFGLFVSAQAGQGLGFICTSCGGHSGKALFIPSIPGFFGGGTRPCPHCGTIPDVPPQPCPNGNCNGASSLLSALGAPGPAFPPAAPQYAAPPLPQYASNVNYGTAPSAPTGTYSAPALNGPSQVALISGGQAQGGYSAPIAGGQAQGGYSAPISGGQTQGEYRSPMSEGQALAVGYSASGGQTQGVYSAPVSGVQTQGGYSAPAVGSYNSAVSSNVYPQQRVLRQSQSNNRMPYSPIHKIN